MQINMPKGNKTSQKCAKAPLSKKSAAAPPHAVVEHPSCRIFDVENAMDEDPGYFDDVAQIENRNDFPAAFEDNSTMHAASVSEKTSRSKAVKLSKPLSKRQNLTPRRCVLLIFVLLESLGTF